ncbi:metallophosphoesterase family protein [Hahella ganghwensis]|uniref:metallophosphoesterase family protein n=1 Tax=Hahella ganghwensis TaxID=286420 RepID=UPI00037853CA|nr:metallophosphoesterase [Hahella ganghwensis]
METIKIVHISDLHISEHLTRGADSHFKWPHRYGHNMQAFLALDGFLKKKDWDLLVITGDVSRIGNSESFEYVRNWLENEINIGAHSVGLNLSKDENRRYIIIPGNHDRFNGAKVQGSLEKYNHEFPVVRSGTTESLFVSDVRVNIHLYDSTQDNHSFAYGFIDQKNLTPKNCAPEDLGRV